MHTIDKNDTVFHFLQKNDSSVVNSYYGWELGIRHFFYNYMIGYKNAANSLCNSIIEAANDSKIEFTDTVVYPYVFTAYHTIELLLKYSYLELRERSKFEITNYMKKGSHKLNKLWGIIKPDFIILSQRLGIDFDFCAVEHYINEFEKNDDNSMSYRYPIRKDLEKYHKQWKHLDITQLNNSLNSFVDYMYEKVRIMSSNLMDAEYCDSFADSFTKLLVKSQKKIHEAIEHIQKNIDKEVPYDGIRIIKFSDIKLPTKEDIQEENRWISSYTEEQKSLLLLLYYTGRHLPQYRLAIEKAERKRDVQKLLYIHSDNESELSSPKSDSKDELFGVYIFHGNRLSLKYITDILNELDDII